MVTSHLSALYGKLTKKMLATYMGHLLGEVVRDNVSSLFWIKGASALFFIEVSHG
jgi:hypothetical protein